mgnify:CR=1 FL=1
MVKAYSVIFIAGDSYSERYLPGEFDLVEDVFRSEEEVVQDLKKYLEDLNYSLSQYAVVQREVGPWEFVRRLKDDE